MELGVDITYKGRIWLVYWSVNSHTESSVESAYTSEALANKRVEELKQGAEPAYCFWVLPTNLYADKVE
jgi:hypothetical protein